MGPERWRQVEELFRTVREHGPAALADAEPEVRREVEELLAQTSGDQTQDMPLADPGLAGQKISHYKILEKLGAGGMGVVYKAFDVKLGRLVALKFLPPEMRHNDELKRRLAEEARAASALDHPNIVVIHDIDEAPGGGLFIAMAFHDGATLQERIRAGMPVAEALQIARQIAAGLAKAHEHGLLHRDIKPGNVIVAKDGVARIIDFGLAKAHDSTATQDGTTKGTPFYMSPEQASGKPVDFRTDLWSLGAVLYEMLAGRPPFQGETHLQVMRAVVQDQPPALRELRPDISAEIEAIVARALQKDPARRYQSAGEMAADLSAVLSGFDISGITRSAVQGAPDRRRRALYAAVALAALAAVAALVWRSGGPRRPLTSSNEYIRLTNFNDSATAPALSPDGRMLAFFRGGRYFMGRGQVYVKYLPDGESKQLTFDSTTKYDPVFTPDSSRVAYTGRSELGKTFDTWTVPVLGGQPTRLMVNAAGMSWIGPDRVLFSEIMAGTALHMGIVTAKESRAEERPLYFPAHERAMAHYSWLSPDRGWVLLVEMNGATLWQRCRVIPMAGNSAGVPVGPQGACTAAAWSPDGRWMYFNVEVDGSTHLWRQRWRNAPHGDPEQITFGPTEEEGLAVDPDGKALIASVGVRQSSVEVHDTDGNHTVSVEGLAESPRLSPDGKRLYFLMGKSSLSEVKDLWRRDLLSGKSDPVVTGQSIVDYDISHDESRVAFTVRKGEESQIFLAAADRSSPPRLMVRGGDLVSFGAGQLIFRQVAGKANYLARVQEDGSGLARVLDSTIIAKHGVSPDGEWAVVNGIGAVHGAFAISLRDHSRQMMICAVVCTVQWSPDGKYLYVAAGTPRVGAYATSAGLTHVIPIPHGIEHLDLPASGVDLAGDKQLAGIRSIPVADMSPGPDPQTYAFTNAAFQGNLFRIPLH